MRSLCSLNKERGLSAMKNKLTLAATFICLLGFLCLALVGCGGVAGNSATQSDAGSTGTDEAVTDLPATYALVEEGVLTGVSDMEYPPFEYIPEGGSDPEGFEIELMNEVASRLGLKMKWLDPMTFDTIIPAIKQGGKADVGVAAFGITEARKQDVDFTNPYLASDQGIVMKEGSDKIAAQDTDTKKNLNVPGATVAVQKGTTGEEWVRSNLYNAICVPLDDATDIMDGVADGTYDAGVADLPAVSYFCANDYMDCEVAVDIPTDEDYGIAVSKKNPKLTADINEALVDMAKDGTMIKLQEKWFGTTL